MLGVGMMAIVQFEEVGEEYFLLAEVNVRACGVRVDIFEAKDVSARRFAARGCAGGFLVESFGRAAISFRLEHGAEEVEPRGVAPCLAKQSAERVFDEMDVLVPDGLANFYQSRAQLFTRARGL